MRNIYDLTKEEFEEYFLSINDKKFRATQIYEFLYKKRVKSIDECVNIGNNIKDKLKCEFEFSMIK